MLTLEMFEADQARHSWVAAYVQKNMYTRDQLEQGALQKDTRVMGFAQRGTLQLNLVAQ